MTLSNVIRAQEEVPTSQVAPRPQIRLELVKNTPSQNAPQNSTFCSACPSSIGTRLDWRPIGWLIVWLIKLWITVGIVRDESEGSCPKLIANPQNNKFKCISDMSAHLGQMAHCKQILAAVINISKLWWLYFEVIWDIHLVVNELSTKSYSLRQCLSSRQSCLGPSKELRGLSSCQDPHIHSLSALGGQYTNENLFSLNPAKQVIMHSDLSCCRVFHPFVCFVRCQCQV